MTTASSRTQVKPGDVFAIPLRGKGYGFGRLLYQKGRWKLAEFFGFFSKEPTFTEEILQAGRALPVHNIVTLPIESGDWPVLQHCAPSEADLDGLRFYRGLKGSRSYVGLDGTSGPLDEELVQDMASSMPQFPEFVSERLWERLQEQGLVE